MARIVEIPIEKITPEAFRPFGQMLCPPDAPPVWKRPGLDSWRMGFEIDGTIDVKVSRFLYKPLEFELLERHLTYTESRVPLAGARAVFVAAPSKDVNDPKEIPDPSSVRAFFLDGSHGLLAWRGTWHALDTFPARPPAATFVILTEKETQKEIESTTAAVTTTRTHVADYRPLGVKFRLVDPHGFLRRP